MKALEINTYRVTIDTDYVIGVHATSEQAVREWLDSDFEPCSIELLERTGNYCEGFNTCLALYNSL